MNSEEPNQSEKDTPFEQEGGGVTENQGESGGPEEGQDKVNARTENQEESETPTENKESEFSDPLPSDKNYTPVTTEDQNNDTPKKQKLPGVIALFKESIRILKINPKTYLTVMIIPMVIPIIFVLLGLVAGFSMLRFEKVIEAVFRLGLVYMIVFGLVYTFAFLIAGSWIQASIFLTLKKRSEKDLTILEALKAGFSIIGPFTILSILGFLIVISPYIIPLAIPTFAPSTVILNLFVIVFTLLLLIPVLILAIKISLSTLVLVGEGLKGFNALAKSSNYVRGYWWPVLIRFIGLGGIMLLVGIITDIIADILVLEPMIWVFRTLVNIILSSVGLIYVYLIYENLRDIKKDKIAELPTKKQKAPYIVLAVLGAIVVIGLIFLISRLWFPSNYIPSPEGPWAPY